jgi:hypothetical protein
MSGSSLEVSVRRRRFRCDEHGLAAAEALVRKVIADVTEEVTALGLRVEKLPILFGRKDEVAVNVAALEAQIKNSPRSDVGDCRQQFRFQRLPVQV